MKKAVLAGLRVARLLALPLVLFAAASSPAFSQQGAPAPLHVDTGDTAWMMAATALVMLMTPGLALFYAGMVRAKNVMSVLMQSFVACGLVTIQWILFGYSLAFGPDAHGVIGNLSWAFLNHVGLDPSRSYAPTVPHEIFMLFELMFAIITPALISGAIVERMKFGAYLLFIFLWATLVYDPLAHWVWGDGGWLHKKGLLDFAGGTVVEIASGVSALVLALMLGKRRRDGGDELRPHNLPMTLTGAALLWFGWFGFNAGSAISSGKLAVNAFVDTHIAMAAAAFGWMLLDWKTYKKPTGLGFVSGAIAGGVAITPACGYVSPMSALVIGLVVSVVSFYGIRIKNIFKCDESLDVFGVHGCGGIWGTLATGLFASAAINGTDGLIHGNLRQFLVQLLAVVVSIAYTALGTFVVAKLAHGITRGLRVSREEEEMGLDLTDHGESGYSAEGAGGVFKPGFATE